MTSIQTLFGQMKRGTECQLCLAPICSCHKCQLPREFITKMSLSLGSIVQWLAYLPLDPATLGSNPNCKFPISPEEKISEVHQWHWLEESGPWHENVDQTHLVLGSGKPVLQKTCHGEIESTVLVKAMGTAKASQS